jgi:Fe-S oxidoreductase
MSDEPKPTPRVPFDYGSHFGNVRTISELLRDPKERNWLTTMPREPEHHKYVVWLGCSITRTAHIADTLNDVLRYLDADFVALGGPSNCCGIVHNGQGDKAVADNMLRKTVSKFDAFTPEKMLNWCPSCNTELKRLSPEDMTETTKGRGSVTTFLGDNVDRLALSHSVPMKVAIHSHGGTPDEDGDGAAVRKILARIPGLEIVDMDPVTKYEHHCSDANVRLHGKDVYVASFHDWIAETKRQGATHIVTVYHSCHRQMLLTQMAFPENERIEVVNYLTLIARSLGLEEREDTFARFSKSGDIDAMMSELTPKLEGLGLDEARARKSLVAHFGESRK